MIGKRKGSVDLVPQSWSPASIFEDMEHLFSDMRSGLVVPGWISTAGEGTRSPMLDMKEESDRFLVQAELPGMSREDVTVEVDQETLRITAVKEQELDEKKEGYLRLERGSMRFFRQVRLPQNVDRDGIKANMENGVLDVSLPKVPVVEERRSMIQVE
ncbi:MAG: Hsp20/alpha crystallin family protein [Methanomassiliicoccus sp.]|nr:MAG: Hsp20/alpha crystallin family protein [Methanomassiliicoccus sp.]